MAIQYVHNFFRRDPSRPSKDKKLDSFVQKSKGQCQAKFLDEDKQFLRITRAFVESNSVEDTIEDLFKAMKRRGFKKYWQRKLTVTGCYSDYVDVDVADLWKREDLTATREIGMKINYASIATGFGWFARGFIGLCGTVKRWTKNAMGGILGSETSTEDEVLTIPAPQTVTNSWHSSSQPPYGVCIDS
ncbi:hypothetical protein FOQG_09788 [Fusarium oxysporum f. sp. raphani 54005]|uniref:Uncharacterized protein n=2 Tax=Fusarium oxysporum f. sp. raphani TaxID=96318 RepID=X0BWF0_FUSOX|nr:hypothetical protein FOQG_09788 [Fusarium oxysporum f. sp. raphani 54005]KAG7428382.1 hypothetical protein Forpi1262_v010340 [Fusarium oxysporum f. sp. raphani]